MPYDIELRENLGIIVKEVEAAALAASEKPTLPQDQLAEFLSFLTKVSHVVEQAFRDVLIILIEIKYIKDSDLDTGKIFDLRRSIDMVLARSHYRDAEEICSRLKQLKELYITKFALLFERQQYPEWSGLFGLIEDREGRIINLIESVMRDIVFRLDGIHHDELPSLRSYADQQAYVISSNLRELTSFTNQILGLGGEQGMLELIRGGSDRREVAREIRVMVQGDINTISGQGGVILTGHASAGDITQNQQGSVPNMDLSSLAAELADLRVDLKKMAASPEQDIAVGQVAVAEKAAKDGSQNGVLAALRSGGRWIADVAKDSGKELVVAAVKASMGMP